MSPFEQPAFVATAGFLAMAGLMAAVMSVVLFSMWRSHRGQRSRGIRMDGLGWWFLATLAWMAAAALFVGRGLIPDLLSTIVANALLGLGTLAYLVGTCRFHGTDPPWRAWLVVLAAEVAALLWWTYGEPSFRLRVIAVTLTLGALYVALLHFVLRRGSRHFPNRFVAAVLAAHLLVVLGRLLSALEGSVGEQLLQATLGQLVYLGSYAITHLMLAVGAVLLASDRLRSTLEFMATHDPLTLVLNRRAVLDQAERELARSRRHGHPWCLLMIDLDHFKQVNDSHGHRHGDEVLKHFARTTQAQLRKSDSLGRYGGEEFVLLLPHTPLAAATQLAERVRRSLASGHALDCKVSMGATQWRGAEDTLDAMLTRGDAALYRAKAQGRDRVCVE